MLFLPLILKLNPSATVPAALKQDLDAVYANPDWQGSLTGCLVEDTDGNVLYSRNSDLRLTPASNNKIYANSFALKVLGPDFRPKTCLWKKDGAIWVAAYGSPLLMPDQLKQAAQKFDPTLSLPVKVWQAYAPGWCGDWELGDLGYKYAAPVTAFTIDRGIFRLFNQNGKPVLKPQPFGNKIDWTDRDNPKFNDYFDPFTHTVHLTGKLPKGPDAVDKYAIPKPDLQAALYLGKSFETVSQIPDGPPDEVIYGQPLSKTMTKCLQESDNNIAENMMMMAASNGKQLTDPYDQAPAAEQKFLNDEIGLTRKDVIIDDGSGLSHQNCTSPNALVKLLSWHLKQPTANLWRSMLAHPGAGTMYSRLTNLDLQCKTGSMTRVSSICGYLNLKDGRTILFSLIENNFSATGHQAKLLENKVLETIAKDLSNGT